MTDGNSKTATGRWVGRGVPRPEGLAKVRGETQYVDDLPFEGLYGATVRTTIPRGHLRAIRFLPGGPDWDEFVVVTASDLPTTSPRDGIDPNQVALLDREQPYLVRGAFRHKHEPVALIAHRRQEMVREALAFIELDEEPAPAVLDYRLPPAADQIQHRADNVFKRIHVRKGAAEDNGGEGFEAVFTAADHVVAAVWETGHQEQCYIEPNGMIARVERDPSDASPGMWPEQPYKIVFEGSIQCPYYVHKAMTVLFDLPDDRVQVIQAATGGGFGGKEEYPSILAGHAGLLALKARRPVKMIYDRLEDMVATTKRHPCRTEMRVALDAQGHILAVDMHVVMDGGAYMTLTPVVLSRGVIHAVGPYRIDHVRVEAQALLSNTPPNGAFRGFGAPQTIFAFERHLDLCAARLGIDPIALRKRNLIEVGDTLAVGQRIEEPIRLVAWLDDALERFDWTARKARHDALNRDHERSGHPVRRGLGAAVFMHGAGFTGSGEDALASIVAVRATETGGVEILTANTEIGQGTVTIFTQVAADACGLELEDISVANPDTDRVPNSGPTVASRTAMVVGQLVGCACDDLVRRLEEAGLLGNADRSPVPIDGPVSALCEGRGRRWRSESLRRALAEAARRGDDATARGEAQYERPPGDPWDDTNYKGRAYGTFAWAVYLAEVEVDLTSFETHVTDFLASQEIGRVLNPILARGQIEGGVVQGIGWALLESTAMVDGGMANGNMTNYAVPTFADVPDLKIHFHEQPYPWGPFGAKGIGELPMDGPAPAILNAIHHATGLQVHKIPCTPEVLMRAWLAARDDG